MPSAPPSTEALIEQTLWVLGEVHKKGGGPNEEKLVYAVLVQELRYRLRSDHAVVMKLVAASPHSDGEVVRVLERAEWSDQRIVRGLRAGQWSDFAEIFEKTRAEAVAAANIFQYIDQSVYLAKKYLHEHGYNVRTPDLMLN